MPLEAATYINQLVPTNPTGTDNKAQGDDHIRMVKRTLQNTFPNVDAPVTVTPAQLNSLGQPGVVCFPGMIVMWSGSITSIPGGWKLCNGDGTLSTGDPVPNLVDKFILGAGTTNIGATGGSATHTHTATVAGTALTVDQLPPHNHKKTYSYAAGGALNNGFVYNNADVYYGGGDSIGGGGNKTMTTDNTGSGQTHTHTATVTSASNLPPYFALAYIIKV